MNLEQIKETLVGDWASIAPEIRPSASKNPDGTLKPFYLKRDFKYLAGDRLDRKSTRLNSSHVTTSRMPSSA